MSNTSPQSDSVDILFKLNAVGVQFGRVNALVDCTLTIGRGERLALVGANGSGKSTLLRHLHGLLPASSGHMLKPVPARQAMLFQRPYMLRTSVQNNVAMGLWLSGMRWGAARQQALVALERVGLVDLALRSGKTLSGGQQQRLALARAWAIKPQVLLLDEPTASLDPTAKREVESLMGEFADAGMTLIFSSHNLGQVKRLASRVIYLEHGHVLADAPVKAFFGGALPPAAAQFLKGELG
ncbi:MAG: ATP-binding cassette domain-containing protein [Polaromonas sp.]|nr:ATP-binding cassette domain-containing protein [Polaromonas sp.]